MDIDPRYVSTGLSRRSIWALEHLARARGFITYGVRINFSGRWQHLTLHTTPLGVALAEPTDLTQVFGVDYIVVRSAGHHIFTEQLL